MRGSPGPHRTPIISHTVWNQTRPDGLCFGTSEWGIAVAIVLVVEDEEQVRVLAESILQDADHQTITAANADEALSLLKSDRTIDVLFTDLGLGTDLQAGIQIALEASKLRPGLPVLYTTGQGITDGMKALFIEASHLLPKPYTVEQLNAALGVALRQTGAAK